MSEVVKIGKRGSLILPAELRQKLKLVDGSHVLIEEADGGVFIRPAVVMPVEIYTPERKAEFFLNNAIDEEDYELARKEVQAMGLDPDSIDHDKPPQMSE